MFMYCFNIFYIGKAYFNFRKTGGIKGDRSQYNKLPEEKYLEKAKDLANKGGEALEKRIDAADEEKK